MCSSARDSGCFRGLLHMVAAGPRIGVCAGQVGGDEVGDPVIGNSPSPRRFPLGPWSSSGCVRVVAVASGSCRRGAVAGVWWRRMPRARSTGGQPASKCANRCAVSGTEQRTFAAPEASNDPPGCYPSSLIRWISSAVDVVHWTVH